MRPFINPQQKILTENNLQQKLNDWRSSGKTIAFTNGCFDILHSGHIASLNAAAQEADLLLVGLNADDSVKRLKGPDRPLNNEQARALLLASLYVVDGVIIFSEDTPLEIINIIKPDVLVKGGDYTIETIVGAKEVIANGGRVVINPVVPGFSTTSLINKIKT
ncbi:MAG: D-glycero-beta-D-manno-heptose 1-phosphate adenylyltransferase [Bacteroidota bacterium]|nr:D-glycero-beta-D-manno-heptose 1-phosphate adenylyltransferase [Bacteroidota bacterium]